MRTGSAAVVLALACALAPALARASTAPPVQWCGEGTAPAASDRPDVVTGRQIHVIYAIPTDGVDRFSIFGSAIATDLGAVNAWWRGQDYTRAPRFDLAAIGCTGTIGSLDISDVKLSHDSTYYYDPASRLGHVRDDLVAAGFANLYKKYLVYYDTPQPLTPNLCGNGFIDPQHGGPLGYAGVWIAPNLESSPTTSGCGMMEDPSLRGGYSASVAAHELLHTLGALDTWDTPGPPHLCPSSPSHACDNPLDIMEPGGVTYWLDNTYLDWGHDDYYGHSGTWWDTQDSPWLLHLNEPQYTLTIDQGAGVASVTSDLPGVACTPAAPCATAWQTGSTLTLNATPTAGFTRLLWGGACAAAGSTPACDLTVGADANVTVSYLKAITIGAAVTSSYHRHPARVQARLALSRPPVLGEASIDCHATTGLRLVSHGIGGSTAICTWAVPARLAGRRLAGRVTVGLDDGGSLVRTFALRLPKHL